MRDNVGGQGSKYSLYSQAGSLMFDSDLRKQQQHEYIYLGGSLVATREKDTVTGAYSNRYQHTDALGSPVVVTSQARSVLERTEYEPFGQVLNRPLKGGPGYTGHVEDAATGLVQMQQRYYDPGIGRFLSVDPVTTNSSSGANFNRYWYANNNPYKFKDPDGRLACGGDFECDRQVRELEQRGIYPLEEGSGSKGKSEGCTAEACRDVQATHANIIRGWGEGLQEAGKFGLKEAAMFYGPAKLGGWLKGLGRVFGGAARSLDDLGSLRGARISSVEKLADEKYLKLRWTKKPLRDGNGIRYFDGKCNSFQLNNGYVGGGNVHGGPYIKISQGNEVIRIPLDGNPGL